MQTGRMTPGVSYARILIKEFEFEHRSFWFPLEFLAVCLGFMAIVCVFCSVVNGGLFRLINKGARGFILAETNDEDGRSPEEVLEQYFLQGRSQLERYRQATEQRNEQEVGVSMILDSSVMAEEREEEKYPEGRF
jgi:hypothetical protein